MITWLSNLAGALHRDSSSVRELLLRAQRDRAHVELIIDHPPKKPVVLVTTIEQVGESDFVISQPTTEGLTHRLARYEPMQIVLPGAGERVAGETRMIGRARITAGDHKHMLYGYRLEMPHELQASNRREKSRVTVGFDLAPEAEIRLLDHSVPLYAVVMDLSQRGAKLRVRNGFDKLAAGDAISLTLHLPPPVGQVSQRVRITHVQHRGAQALVGVQFLTRIEGLAELVHTRELHRAKRWS